MHFAFRPFSIPAHRLINRVPFRISYGGFGTILTKAALDNLSKPIHCPADKHVCNKIHQDLVGESFLFKNGMSILELFYKYSALEDFCMHADWVLSYVIEHFLPQNADSSKRLVGIKSYPYCGNYTLSGSVRSCTVQSSSCHNLTTSDMKALALEAYASHPESYNSFPKWERTEWDIVKKTLLESLDVENALPRHPSIRRAQVLVSFHNYDISDQTMVISPHPNLVACSS